MQTLAADRIFRLLQVHITFRVTFVIFVVNVAYDVAIVLFQICMNSPVHRIKEKIGYQSDSVLMIRVRSVETQLKTIRIPAVSRQPRRRKLGTQFLCNNYSCQ